VNNDLDHKIHEYIDRHQGDLIQIVSDLVKIPSVNTPPLGTERDCQSYLASALHGIGWRPELYRPDQVPGVVEHPLYWAGRDYCDRPNLGARRKGQGGGRSLVLSGHIDTVPVGSVPWTHDPFGAEIEGNHLYGRGANDMKAGVATNLFVLQALHDLGVRLLGDLIFESAVDEEFGGSNGTLAGRIAGFNADAAVFSEPSFLRICPAQRGGRTAHIELRAPAEGILDENGLGAGVVTQLHHLLSKLAEFAELRRATAPPHPLYPRHTADPVPVSVTKISTGPWGTQEPIAVPGSCLVELYWQAMPGESQETVDGQFFTWMDGVVASAPELFPMAPSVTFPTRWLPGSESPASPLVPELAACCAAVLGHSPVIEGIEGPGDIFLFQREFGIPAVYWGARGANTHAADEYVEIDSVVAAAHALLLFVCRWCGVANEG
jgi:acetylornithine deacetylase